MVEGGFVDCDRMGNLECQQYSSLSHWLNLVTPKLCEKVVDAGPKGQCEEGGWLVGEKVKFINRKLFLNSCEGKTYLRP